MSSTRKAKDGSVFHQNRYASSPEFERGLIANLVAKRCAMLDDKADRELVWFVQYLSHQSGGLAAVAADLLACFPERLGTRAMLQTGKSTSQNFAAPEVCEIRIELPPALRHRFQLKGELKSEVRDLRTKYDRLASQAEIARALRAAQENIFSDSASFEETMTGEREKIEKSEREIAAKHPASYPVATLRELCRRAAVEGLPEAAGDGDYWASGPLDSDLAKMCLKPGGSLAAAAPWYFADLVNVLREYQQRWAEQKSKFVVTTLGRKVCDTLEYCEATRSMALLEGNPRLGKSFSVRAWCEQHPGKARFVEVSTGNDEISFFRELARSLGLGNFQNYKALEIRDRVESVLRSGDILLVLDEAQRLWPQRNLRYGFPGRIVWVMSMANAGVPICMISTPQFIQSQKAVEKTGWNSAQLTGRIGHYEFLPVDLTLADLKAVGRSVLPEASEEILNALASYARVSARYLAAVDSIAKRAKFIAQRNGRRNCTAADVRAAMKDSIIPSDTLLVRNLEAAKKSSGKIIPVPPIQDESLNVENDPTESRPESVSSGLRGTRPVPAPAFTRRTDLMEMAAA